MKTSTIFVALVGVSIFAVTGFAFFARPPVTLTVRGFTNDSRVAEMYIGSNFQSVVAIIEMKNNSNREFVYSSWISSPRIPYFKAVIERVMFGRTMRLMQRVLALKLSVQRLCPDNLGCPVL